MKKTAERLTPLTLELGGKNPVIVDPLYPIEEAAKKTSWGKFFNSGQSCVAPDYVFVHKDQEKAFIDSYMHFSRKYMENHESDYMKIVNERHFNRLLGYMEQGEILAGGESDREDLLIRPTLLKPKSLEEPVMQEEIFGPVLPVITFEEKSEILAITRRLGKPLVVNLFSKKKKEIAYWLGNTYSGNVVINDTLINYVNKNLPFGGVGESGNGAYHGKASFDLFSHYRSVIHKLPPDLPLRYPPYTWQFKVVRKLRKILNWGI
jgi:aldehyde dehydrogenase (NAD+)